MAANVGSATLAINKPAGGAAGDTYVIFVYHEEVSSTPTVSCTGFSTITGPAGGYIYSSPKGIYVSVLWKTHSGSEGSTFSVVASGGAIELTCLLIRDADTTTPPIFSTINGYSNGSASTVSCNGLTTLVNDCLGIIFWADTNGVIGTVSASTWSLHDTNQESAVLTKTLTTAGVVSSVAVNWSGNASVAAEAQMFAFAPASGTVDITGTSATVVVSSNVGVTGSDPVKISDRGIRTSTGTGNGTLAITNPTQIAVGNYLVARVSVDNSGTSGARPGLAFSDTRNGTWTHGTGALQDPGTASSGIATYLCYVKVTTPYQVGDVFSFAWTTGSPRSAIVVEEWANIDQITPLAVAEVQANNVSSTAQPALSRTPTAVGQLMYVAAGIEGFSSYWGAQDSDSTGGSWVALTKDEANTGTAATSVSIYGGYKVVTTTDAQTWNNTLGTTSDWAACAVVFAKAVTTVDIIGTSASVAVTSGSAVVAGTASVTGTPASVAVTAGSATIGIGINITGTPATVVVTAGSATLTATTAVTGTSATVAVQSISATIGVAGTFTEDFTGTNDALLANGWHDDSTFGGSSPMVVIESNRGSSHNNTVIHAAWKLHGLTLASHDWQVDFDMFGPLPIGNGGVSLLLVSNTTGQGWGLFVGNAVHIQKKAVGGGNSNLTNIDRPGDTGSLQNHVTFTHRGSDGYMAVYLDGNLFADTTDNTQSAGNMVYISLQDTSSPTTEAWIDTLVISDTITGPPGAGTNITGTSATVTVTAGSATLTANTAITGTPSTVAVSSSSATVNGNAAITGTPSSVAVNAGSATVTGQANVTGSSAVVTIQSSTGTISAQTDITGTSATVAITAGSASIGFAASITGTSATIAVTAGSAVVTGNAAVVGTSAFVAVNAGSAVVTGNAAVVGTSAFVAVNAGSAVLTANTAITGTSAIVVINAGSAILTATTPITGTSATVVVTAGSATIVLAVSISGSSAIVAVHAGTGIIGVQTDITGTPASVAVHAYTITVSGHAAITGTSANIAVQADTGTIGTAGDITGITAVVTVVAGTGIIGVLTAIVGVGAIVAVIAGSGQISAEGTYIPPMQQGAIIIL
jgi:hypothetical protein